MGCSQPMKLCYNVCGTQGFLRSSVAPNGVKSDALDLSARRMLSETGLKLFEAHMEVTEAENRHRTTLWAPVKPHGGDHTS